MKSSYPKRALSLALLLIIGQSLVDRPMLYGMDEAVDKAGDKTQNLGSKVISKVTEHPYVMVVAGIAGTLYAGRRIWSWATRPAPDYEKALARLIILQEIKINAQKDWGEVLNKLEDPTRIYIYSEVLHGMPEGIEDEPELTKILENSLMACRQGHKNVVTSQDQASMLEAYNAFKEKYSALLKVVDSLMKEQEDIISQAPAPAEEQKAAVPTVAQQNEKLQEEILQRISILSLVLIKAGEDIKNANKVMVSKDDVSCKGVSKVGKLLQYCPKDLREVTKLMLSFNTVYVQFMYQPSSRNKLYSQLIQSNEQLEKAIRSLTTSLEKQINQTGSSTAQGTTVSETERGQSDGITSVKPTPVPISLAHDVDVPSKIRRSGSLEFLPLLR